MENQVQTIYQCSIDFLLFDVVFLSILETQAQDTDNPDMIAALLKSASTEAEQKTDVRIELF